MNSLGFFRWIVPFCVLHIFITACDNGGDEPINIHPPAESACGTPNTNPFASPALVTAVNSADVDSGAEVTNGNLSLYLHSSRSGGYGNFDIYVSDRASQTDDWGTPVNLGSNINTSFDDRAPTVSSDGLTLIFASDRDGDFDLYISTRNSVNDAWGPATNIGDSINSPEMDTGPSLSEDELTLVFSSLRSGGWGSSDIYTSTRANTADAWSTPMNLGSTVNTVYPEVAPDISCDGLRMYFQGGADLVYTERSSLTAPWSATTIVPSPVTTPDIEHTPSISADETTLYFTSNRPGSESLDIWMVTR
jgi:Tol biopolymer transport system component